MRRSPAVSTSPRHARSTSKEFTEMKPSPPSSSFRRSHSNLNSTQRLGRSPRLQRIESTVTNSGAQTARNASSPQELDLSLYDRNHKINRTRTNILQTSLMVPFKLGGGGWSRMKRFPIKKKEGNSKFLNQPNMTEKSSGAVKFSRTNRWKEQDMLAASGAPGPGHYANVEENGLRGPVYAFSSCPRDTDPTRSSATDREWKEKLGPGSYDVALAQHAVRSSLPRC